MASSLANLKIDADGYVFQMQDVVLVNLPTGWTAMSKISGNDLVSKVSPFQVIFQNVEIMEYEIAHNAGFLILKYNDNVDLTGEKPSVKGESKVILAQRWVKILEQPVTMTVKEFIDSSGATTAAIYNPAAAADFEIAVKLKIRLKGILPGSGIPDLTKKKTKDKTVDVTLLQRINIIKALQEFDNIQNTSFSG